MLSVDACLKGRGGVSYAGGASAVRLAEKRAAINCAGDLAKEPD